MNDKIQELIGMEKGDESWEEYFQRANEAGQVDQKIIYQVVSLLVEELNAEKEKNRIRLSREGKEVQRRTDEPAREIPIQDSDKTSEPTNE